MKFLFVHEVNWLEKVTYEIHEIPELLSIAGHQVTFLDFPEFNKNDSRNRTFSFRTSRMYGQSRAYSGSKVDVFTPGGVVGGKFRRYFASLTFIPLFWRTVKRQEIDVVVLYGVPTNGWQTIFLAKILKVPVIFRAIDISHLLRKSRFKLLVKFAERYIYKSVDHISAHNIALKNYCVILGAAADNVSINFPRLDLDRFKPSSRDGSLGLSYGIQLNQKVVFFRGTLYRFSGLEKFIELFSGYLRENPDVCVLVVGSGEAEKSIQETILRLNLTHQVILTPFVNYDDLAKHLCLADVSINTFVPSLVTHCVLPGRVLQSLACAIPVVSTPLQGMMSYSQGSEAVIYRELDDSFVQAIVELLADSERRNQLGLTGRQLVANKGTWSDFVEDFVDIAEKLVAKK